MLEQFQDTETHIAIIIDEHGGVDGLLTLTNLLTFLVAPAAGARSRREDAAIVQRTESASPFSAVEGLGLELHRRQAPLDVVVVDGIERTPTEN